MLLSPLASVAGDIQSNTSPSQIKLEIYQKKQNSGIRRSPSRGGISFGMEIPIYVLYDNASQTLYVYGQEDIEGQVYLYLNGAEVDYSSDINTSFSITTTGAYYIEIATENWIVEGRLTI